tara:strand:- start:3032 stop:3232 length:201 start_codon:yes stop_codon:yes gene_type:complete
MKIKLKDKNTRLPRCWKSCGVDKDAWDKLQNGEQIEVKQIGEAVQPLVEKLQTTATPITKSKKESK